MGKIFRVRIIAFAVLLSWVGCQRETPPSAPADRVSAPEAPGQTHLTFSGVTANFPRIAAWLLTDMQREFPRGGYRGDILFIGTGAGRGIQNVGEGLAQFTVTTPAATAYMAYQGTGLFKKSYSHLRGLFKLPQRDPITWAVRADLGIGTTEEWIQKKVPLKVASGFQDSERAIGFLFAEFLKASGTSLADLESWGGELLPTDNAGPGVEMVAEGKADAIFHEAAVVGSPAWKQLNAKIPMRVLSIPENVIAKLELYGFHKFEAVLPKGKYPGVLEDVTTIDYSDWIVIADAGVPEDIAYKLTKIGVERKSEFESQYPDMAPAGSKELGQYVADPRQMWRDLGLPLHPGAERYFKEKGLMP